MNHREVAETVQVGQTVGYGRYASRGLTGTGFAKVTKKNGHGHITLDNDLVFDKHGEERNVVFGPKVLFLESELRERLTAADAQRDLDRRMHALLTLTEEKIRGRRNGFGNYAPLTAEDKAALIAAIEAV